MKDEIPSKQLIELEFVQAGNLQEEELSGFKEKHIKSSKKIN